LHGLATIDDEKQMGRWPPPNSSGRAGHPMGGHGYHRLVCGRHGFESARHDIEQTARHQVCYQRTVRVSVSFPSAPKSGLPLMEVSEVALNGAKRFVGITILVGYKL
jgi:hypothetical protein